VGGVGAGAVSFQEFCSGSQRMFSISVVVVVIVVGVGFLLGCR
jgi:hypothetical protein